MADEDSVVITAPSVEEAVILGLTRLTATRDEVDIEVLDEGSKGFLGIGSRPAKVRVSRRSAVAGAEQAAASQPPSAAPQQATASAEPPEAAPAAPDTEVEEEAAAVAPEPVAAEPVPAPEPEAAEAAPAVAAEAAPVAAAEPQPEQATTQPTAQREPRVTPPAVERHPAVTPPKARPQQRTAPASADGLDRARLEEIAQEIAAHLLPNMDIEVATEWMEEERPTLWVALNGRDADSLVGPRARNLHSIQYLFRALIYHKLDGNYNVVVDADGYRRRRRRSLESLAKDKADRAVELGRTIRLRPMPAHERRIVHMTLREDDRVTTESIGKGRDRAVTVIPQGGNSRGSERGS